MPRFADMDLKEMVRPLPHPDIKRDDLLGAYWAGIIHLDDQAWENPTDLGIQADVYSLKRILGPFWGSGKMSIHHALMDSHKIPRNELWIPVAPGKKLGAPVAPIQRAYDRAASKLLEKQTNNPRFQREAQEFQWFGDVFRAYATQPVLQEGDPTWQWMTEQVAHELYEHARGQDALDDWNRAKILMQEPVLLIP